MSNSLAKMLDIDHSILMAPMFLVSNTKMIIAALENGITAAFPALNYRTDQELRLAIAEIKAATNKPFGVNLIANKSNPKLQAQLKTLIDCNVDFIITSLGNPKVVIEHCKLHGIKVFCDVVDLKYAKKVEALGADALIAVNNMAGGHAGSTNVEELIPLLKTNCSIPVISAGGVSTKEDIERITKLGADGVSVGTAFIASEECMVSPEYKEAIIKYKASDIIMTNKMSGSPLTVINTPYMQELNKSSSLLQYLLSKNKRLKKLIKMLILLKGQKQMENAAFKPTYKTVWVAGPVIENISAIRPVKDIIYTLTGNDQNG